MLDLGDLKVTWLGISGIKLKTAKLVIYIDPYAVYGEEPGDLILITHEHSRHCSADDIRRLAKESTAIICPEYTASSIIHPNIKVMKPGDLLEIEHIKILAVDSYERVRAYLHYKGKGLGYVLDINGTKVYHAGDTDFVPEVASLKNIDIACYPIAGFEDSLTQALDFANIVKPKFIIPIHYNPMTDRKLLGEFETKVINSRLILG